MTFVVALTSSAQQPSPRLIPFQGRLTDQQNRPYTNGQFTVVFRIYSQAVGGTPLNDWVETHQSVGVINGMINVFLGSISSLDPVDFSQTVYLGITIDADNNANTTDPEMVPRQMIIPAFWAKNSEKLAGQDWTPVFGVNSPLGPIPGSKIEEASISAEKIGNGQITLEKLAPSVIPAGTIQAYGGEAVPTGWLLCDGRAVGRAQYATLFSALGTAWGTGDGSTTFNLPDLRGRFLRGVDGGAGNDPDGGLRTQISPGGNTGDRIGSVQADATALPKTAFTYSGTTATAGAHTHPITGKHSSSEGGDGTVSVLTDDQNQGTITFPISAASAGSHSHSFSGSIITGGDLETRPRNAYVHFIIKY